MSRLTSQILLAFFAPAALLAQQPVASQQQHTGSVNGHVSFAGNNSPARFATVALQPVAIKSDDRPFEESQKDPAIHVYQTLLDGSFQIPKVPPGAYYVVVKYPGYLSPFTRFTNAELVRPTPAVQQRIAALLPTVTVTANNTATIDVQLTHGGSVGGVLRFDDGTPYAGTGLNLLQRAPDGKWKPVALLPHASTDDQGHFRFSGLPAGEYLLTTDLTLEDSFTNSVIGQPMMWSSSTRYSIAYYGGNTPRQRDAKPFKLEEGQELDGQDLTIPLSKLHRVSGAIVDQASGRVINDGKVKLMYADNSELATAQVSPEETGFVLSFVPEGEYLLQVTEASDVRRETIQNPPGTMPPFYHKDTTLRTYVGTAPQPLVVQNDVQGINLTVTPAPAPNTAAQ